MRSLNYLGLLVLATASLSACGPTEMPESSDAADAVQQSATPYKPVATVVDLMRGLVTLSAETYWESVSVVVDIDGVHENQPETDLEWIEVWAAAMSLAESGNLLMMPPRAYDNEEWIRISTGLVDVGLKAAQIASARDFEGMLTVGEEIYNVCVECHRIYVPTLPDL
jgi:hypothetical protein